MVGAGLDALTAGRALAVVHLGYAGRKVYASLGALLGADAALKAADGAVLLYLRLVVAVVGARRDGALRVRRDKREEVLGALLDALAASGTPVPYDVGQSVRAHRERVEGADLHAVAEAHAAEGAELGPADGEVRSLAGPHPVVSFRDHPF